MKNTKLKKALGYLIIIQLFAVLFFLMLIQNQPIDLFWYVFLEGEMAACGLALVSLIGFKAMQWILDL